LDIITGRLDKGTEIVSGHQNFQLSVSKVRQYATDSLYGTPLLVYSDPLIRGGDSGYPSFVLDSNGNTTVAGTHYRAFIGKSAYDSPLGIYRSQISAIVSADGYTLGVPEPASFVLTMAILLLLWWLWSKKSKETF